jgi:hypothetical protein
MNANWHDQLPQVLGPLALNGTLHRTEANGSNDAPVTILGVYPAATKWEIFSQGDIKLKLPVEVEERSFDPQSRSGHDLDKLYLSPLHLGRENCLILDLMPYFFANTAKDSDSGRSMWDNVQQYVGLTGVATVIAPRPAEDELLKLCKSMPGNEARLGHYLGRPSLKLLITLGRESAAYIRGHTRAEDAQAFLYTDPKHLDVFGRRVRVVHLVHPGNLQRKDTWRKKYS